MVELCSVFKWWSKNQTEKKPGNGPNVRYSNGLPSQPTLPFENRTPFLSGIQMVTVVGIHIPNLLV